MRFLVLLLLLAFAISLKAGRIDKKIELKEPAKKQLTALFLELEKLHKTLFEGNQPQINSQIEAVRGKINGAVRVSKTEGFKGQHLNKFLISAQESFLAAQSTQGNQRMKFLQVGFKQLVTIYQTHAINNDYTMYWCKIDRSVWLQKSKKLQNPFAPKSNCGRPTR